MTTLREAHAAAQALYRAGDFGRALRAYDGILAAQPLEYEARRAIGELLLKLGAKDQASAVLRAVAAHDVRAGHPLPALAACKVLEGLGFSNDDLLGDMAQSYAAGSPRLARVAARQAPLDPETPLSPPAPAPDEPDAAVVQRAAKRAQDFSVYARYPEQYHPIPFLSELDADVLVAVARAVAVRRLADGQAIIREGEPGQAFYLVVSGEVRVFATDALGRETEIARLHEGSLFGEMALLAAQPRTATVAAVGGADVIEVRREALDAIAARQPAVAAALDRFARERLVKNLLATSPLFRPFSRQQQLDLIRRFDGVDVAPGTEIIREGDPGTGLFVVLSGEVEVSKRDGGGEAQLARLRAGDVFGEMSLLKQQPTTATVRAARPSTVLFLAREYFQRLVDALPTIRSYFEALSERRDLDTKLTLGQDDEIEIDEDVLVRV